MLDGAARIPDAVAAAVNDGQPALGITDLETQFAKCYKNVNAENANCISKAYWN